MRDESPPCDCVNTLMLCYVMLVWLQNFEWTEVAVFLGSSVKRILQSSSPCETNAWISLSASWWDRNSHRLAIFLWNHAVMITLWDLQLNSEFKNTLYIFGLTWEIKLPSLLKRIFFFPIDQSKIILVSVKCFKVVTHPIDNNRSSGSLIHSCYLVQQRYSCCVWSV